jgi:hypothetical protein
MQKSLMVVLPSDAADLKEKPIMTGLGSFSSGLLVRQQIREPRESDFFFLSLHR